MKSSLHGNSIGPRRVFAFGLLLGLAVAATTAEAVAARADVTWAPNPQLSEVRDNPMRRGWLRPEEWQKQIGDEFGKRAERVLPPDQHLEVHIDDIKLAGDFEPWHTRPGLDDARILKDIYPPRIDLHYKLLASDGRVVREGDAKLRDSAYLQRAVPNSTDPLRYDKRMIDEWLAREFKRPPG